MCGGQQKAMFFPLSCYGSCEAHWLYSSSSSSGGSSSPWPGHRAPSWGCSSAQQLCPAALQGDTGRFVPHRGRQSCGQRECKRSPCVYTHIQFRFHKRLTACSLRQPGSVFPLCGVFLLHARRPYSGREGAAGQGGTSRPGCVENFKLR